MASLTFDPTIVPSDAWQTILSTETDTDVHSIKVALYTDTVFSTWAEANPSEAFVNEYSDNVLAMMCSITMYDGTDYIATTTDLSDVYCIVGEKAAWGGAYSSGIFSPILLDWGADLLSPAAGDSITTPLSDNLYEGFTIF